MNRLTVAVPAIAISVLALAGCSNMVPEEPEKPLLGYGPCSTPQECADQSQAVFESIVGIWGDDFAGDCLAAHTESVGKMMSLANDGQDDIETEATSGDCRVTVTIANGTAMEVDFYGV